MSEWKQSAIDRRDERHTKIEGKRLPSRRKPNRKKWCKGKVGVLHTPVWKGVQPFVVFNKDWNKDQREFVCTKCGKVLDWWWGRRWRALSGGRRMHKPKIGSTNADGT